MSGDNASPPSPDPAIGQAALKQAQTGADWLNFAKDAFSVSNDRQADLDALTKQVTESQLGLAQKQQDYADADRARYESTFVPIENDLAQKAQDYATPQAQQQAAAGAKADVENAAAATRAAAQRQAIGMGVNPNSGRFQGLDRSADLATELGVAGAENTARQNVKNEGLALEGQVANLGRGLPVQANADASLGANAGSTAVGLNQGTNSQYLASTNIMNAGYGGAQAGYAGEGSTLSNLYNDQLAGYQVQQQDQNAGLGALGTVAGLFLGGDKPWFLSDEAAKTNKRQLADGEALEQMRDMPVSEYDYKPGRGDGGHHVGPMAQGFARATGRGDGRTIAVQDAVGLTIGAMQDLDRKVDRLSRVVGLGAKSGRGRAAA